MRNSLSNIKSTISRNATNALGWKTDRKIVVFESDDWGSIRMRDLKTYNYLLRNGIRVDLCPYNKYDTIASNNDLTALYETLDKFKDINNNPPVITFNTNTANPDFSKIKDSGYVKYYYKEFTETIKEYYINQRVFDVWEEGIKKRFVYPQYHHREHVNTQLWLELLRDNNKAIKLAFDQEIFGLSFATSKEIKVPYLGSLIIKNNQAFKEISSAIIDGAKIFNKTFKFESKSMIAPLYTWDKKLEKPMQTSGIKYLQAGNIQKVYDYSMLKSKRILNPLGSSNDLGQIYLNRNCSFEPSIDQKKFDIDNVIKEISSAFFWKKPAVLSTHRLNFIGSIDESNRSKNLCHLKDMLEKIQKKWPDVEFMTSTQLGNMMSNNTK